MTPVLGIIASSNQQGRGGGPVGSYDALASIVVPSGGLASVTFAGVPAGYRHLQIRVSSKSNRAVYVDDLGIRLNADTGSNYSWHRMYGFGSGSAQSDGASSQTSMNIGQIAGGTVNNATGFGAAIVDILDYASTSKNTTVRVLSGYDDNGQGAAQFASGAWYNTAAVSAVTLLPLIGTTFSQNSQFALYGVK